MDIHLFLIYVKWISIRGISSPFLDHLETLDIGFQYLKCGKPVVEDLYTSKIIWK